jgi:hypothetical protein
MKRCAPAVAIVLACAAAACAPQLGAGRAQSLPPGQAQGGAGLDLVILSPRLSPTQDVNLPWMNLGLGYRRGLVDRLEVGGRSWIFGIPAFWTWGVAADAKWQLRRAPRGTELAVSGIVGYQQVRNGGTPWHLASVTAAFLIGHNFGRHQLVWGPRLGYQIWAGEGMNAIRMPIAGLSLGFAWRVGKRWEIFPELVVVGSPLRFGGEVDDMERTGAGATQLTLGVSRRF